jgi:hypothetical protein
MKNMNSRVRLSPDDKLAGYIQNDPTTRTSKLMVRPSGAGEARPLLTAPINTIAFQWAWLPDSSGILLVRTTADSKPDGLWVAPLSGQPRKLDVDIRSWQETFAIHPDGNHLAYTAFSGNPGAEVWALENLLPAQVSGASR